MNHAVTPTVVIWFDFMMAVIDKPKLCTTFEVAGFRHCRNIKGEPTNFGLLSKPAGVSAFVIS